MPGGAGFQQAASNGQPRNFNHPRFGGIFDGPGSDASPRGSNYGSPRGSAPGSPRTGGQVINSPRPSSAHPTMSPGQQGGGPGPRSQQVSPKGDLDAARQFQASAGRKVGHESLITNHRVELPAAAYQLDVAVSRDIFFNFCRDTKMLE